MLVFVIAFDVGCYILRFGAKLLASKVRSRAAWPAMSSRCHRQITALPRCWSRCADTGWSCFTRGGAAPACSGRAGCEGVLCAGLAEVRLLL